MTELGEYHKRRILVTFQRVDELLSQSLHVLDPTQHNSQSHPVHDISPSKLLRMENHIKLIRRQMSSFLERFQISLPERSTPSSWIIKTNLTSVDIALEDLYPQKLRGYGNMDSVAANELTQTLQEIRKLVNQLLKTLE
jgi:hypothetical protein